MRKPLFGSIVNIHSICFEAFAFEKVSAFGYRVLVGAGGDVEAGAEGAALRRERGGGADAESTRCRLRPARPLRRPLRDADPRGGDGARGCVLASVSRLGPDLRLDRPVAVAD